MIIWLLIAGALVSASAAFVLSRRKRARTSEEDVVKRRQWAAAMRKNRVWLALFLFAQVVVAVLLPLALASGEPARIRGAETLLVIALLFLSWLPVLKLFRASWDWSVLLPTWFIAFFGRYCAKSILNEHGERELVFFYLPLLVAVAGTYWWALQTEDTIIRS